MKKRKKNFARAVMTCRELLFAWYYLCNDDTWIIILLLIGLKSQQKQISGIALLGEATSIIRRDATSEDCFVRPHVKTYSVLATVQTLDRYKDVSTINFVQYLSTCLVEISDSWLEDGEEVGQAEVGHLVHVRVNVDLKDQPWRYDSCYMYILLE